MLDFHDRAVINEVHQILDAQAETGGLVSVWVNREWDTVTVIERWVTDETLYLRRRDLTDSKERQWSVSDDSVALFAQVIEALPAYACTPAPEEKSPTITVLHLLPNRRLAVTTRGRWRKSDFAALLDAGLYLREDKWRHAEPEPEFSSYLDNIRNRSASAVEMAISGLPATADAFHVLLSGLDDEWLHRADRTNHP